MKMIMGIDTSCYTTSIALIGEDGTIRADKRCLLEVKPGERGLQQSAAIFQHLGNMPRLFQEFEGGLKLKGVIAAAVPRPVAGSYLPVFRVAASFGAAAARLAGVPFMETSHQEGHIRAGLYQQKLGEKFLAWHISGGTTELLLVQAKTWGFHIEKVGGSSDLQAGQFVDRVGVALGTTFPAGPELEKLAQGCKTVESLPVVLEGLDLSFSGPESAAQRLIKAGAAADEVARQVYNCLGRSLFGLTCRAVEKFAINQVLMVGGVASSQLIREYLQATGAQQGIEFSFAASKLASDNAVGVGLIGYDRWK